MKRMLTVMAGIAMLGFSAEAQQQFRCENGELLGGTSDVRARCTVNSTGHITSVTPYAPGERDQVKIYRNSAPAQTVTTAPVKTYRSGQQRTYTPTPLTATPRSAAQATTRTYSTNTQLREQYPTYATRPASTTTVYRPAAVQPRVITAAPTPRIQTAAYAAPCNFRVREVPTRGDIAMYEVCYSDLGQIHGRSIDKLYARIKRASRKACGTQYSSILTRWGSRNNRCVSDSLDRAVMSSNIDSLRAYHLARTGRGIPTVYVGEPRNAY